MGRLTLWGMQQYDKTLLDGVKLPDGMDAEVWKNMLMMEMGPQYPRIQVPPMLKILIGNWFVMRQKDFQMMWEAWSADYNPIENYDRTEDGKDTTKHSGTDTDTDTLGTSVTVTRKGTEETAQTGSEETAERGTDKSRTHGSEKTEESGTDTDALAVSAYDADTYQPREKRTRTPELATTRTPDLTTERTPDLTTTRTPDLKSVRTPDLTDVSSNSGEDIHKRDYGHVEDVSHHLRVHGNIGVTTNQQMIEAELELRSARNIYEIIMGLFEEEFLCRIY